MYESTVVSYLLDKYGNKAEWYGEYRHLCRVYHHEPKLGWSVYVKDITFEYEKIDSTRELQ